MIKLISQQKKLLCRWKTTENQRNQTYPLPTPEKQIKEA